MRLKFTGGEPWGQRYRGKISLVIGQVSDELPDHEAQALLRDYGHCFQVVDGDGKDLRPHLKLDRKLDLKRLRNPDASWSIGIILTTFNGLDLTMRCVESLAPLEDTDLRLYVVDNCSTDGTREWLEYQGIEYEQPIGRCSVPEALNRGVEHFRKDPPDFIFILNNDVVVPDGYISVLISAFVDHAAGWLVGYPRSLYDPEQTEVVDMAGLMTSGDASATLYTWGAIEKVGSWDERFGPRYGEDEDYLTRLELAGYKAVRVPVAYDGDMGGYLVSNPGCETQRESYRRSVKVYIEKWGDAPKSAREHMAHVTDIVGTLPCEGGKKETAPPIVRRGKRAAIIQNGRLGDILTSFAMACELKSKGYHVTWYAMGDYAKIAALNPYVDDVFNTAELKVLGTHDLWALASRPSYEHAELAGYDRILLPQITPQLGAEFLGGAMPYLPFMYAANGLTPRSLKPELVKEPKAVTKDLASISTDKPTLLINFAAHSVPIRIDWPYWERFVKSLNQAMPEVAVYYSEHPDQPWRADVPVNKLGTFKDPRTIAYVASRFDCVVTTSTAPLWSAFAHTKPAVCLLPREQDGGLENNEVISKYALSRQGVLREWPALDVVVSRVGIPERFTAEQLAQVVASVYDGHDLRGIGAEMYTELVGC